MQWNDLQKTAKARGQLVFAMDQSQTPVMTQPGPWGTATTGYCIGLAAAWISGCYTNTSFPVDGNKVCDYPPWKSTWGQNLSDDSNADWIGQWTVVVQPFNMGLSSGLRAYRSSMLTGSFIHSIASKAYGCYGIYVRGTGGAHGIAVRHGRDNRMHFFDANFGHFVVQDHTKLAPFLDWYWPKAGYSPDFLSRGVGIVGVTPALGT
jgi:hypothetical protein